MARKLEDCWLCTTITVAAALATVPFLYLIYHVWRCFRYGVELFAGLS